ncbi:MAG TPA: tetratricopeptide repeat-containing glycosyltransferase family protein [Tepidisphaeraceae bacterium]|nr:tetratricopeptide repeat-containing glycosyltransferase family protein [Tepidisphaeraceae bacterium]
MTLPLDQALSLARSYLQAGRLREAEPIYRHIIRDYPDHPEALHYLGVIGLQCGFLDNAIQLMSRSIALTPGIAHYHRNLAEALRRAGRLDEAEAGFKTALELQPGFPETYHSLALVYEKADRIDEAIACYRQAIALKPTLAESHCNLGVLLERRGGYDEALQLFTRAIELRPNYALAHLSRGLALLRQGNFEAGWREYPWRWQLREFATQRPDPTRPLWDGSDLAGRTLLVRAEQGLGDTLQFSRYVPLLAPRGGQVVFQVQPPLQSLLGRLPGVTQVVASDDPLPPYDLQIPLMDLPRLFGTTLTTIPNTVSYLTPAADRLQAWQNRLAADSTFKVGLVWAGGSLYPGDKKRSISLASFAPLAAVSGITFYSLQKGGPAAQAATPPAGMHLVDLTADLTDFGETAALASCLDLIITVDTAVAHLAGALAKPVWTLVPFIPDFRWFLNRDDTPWYPTMRLFRQPALDDWLSPINRLAAELHALLKT